MALMVFNGGAAGACAMAACGSNSRKNAVKKKRTATPRVIVFCLFYLCRGKLTLRAVGLYSPWLFLYAWLRTSGGATPAQLLLSIIPHNHGEQHVRSYPEASEHHHRRRDCQGARNENQAARRRRARRRRQYRFGAARRQREHVPHGCRARQGMG